MHKLARLTPTGRWLMVRRLEVGEPVRDVAEGLQLSLTTVYRWWRRYRAEGEAGLRDRSSRPHRSPRAWPRWQRRRIRRLRERRWSSLRIAGALGLPVSTVVHIQRRLGLARLGRLEPRRPVIRYERRRPGALVHLDVKKLGRIGRIGHRIHGDWRRRVRGIGWEYVHVAIDDRTRLAYAEIYPDETAASATAFLGRAVRWFARWGVQVRAVMTDNGSGFRGYRFAAASAAPPPARADAAVLAADQREGGALHSDGAGRVGVRTALPDVPGAGECADRLSAVLQPGAAAQRARVSDASSAPHGAAVNNVFVNYT